MLPKDAAAHKRMTVNTTVLCFHNSSHTDSIRVGKFDLKSGTWHYKQDNKRLGYCSPVSSGGPSDVTTLDQHVPALNTHLAFISMGNNASLTSNIMASHLLTLDFIICVGFLSQEQSRNFEKGHQSLSFPQLWKTSPQLSAQTDMNNLTQYNSLPKSKLRS